MSFEVRCSISESVKHIQRACFQLLKYEGGLEICERLRKIENNLKSEIENINDETLEVKIREPKAGRAQ